MKFGSVCSGIEAASVAWNQLGWEATWFSEVEPFPSAVLTHHYPSVSNLGDMKMLPTLIGAGLIDAPDILCGGTPCQAFSAAGLRQSLDDERGNLTLTFCEIANAIDDRRIAAGLAPTIIFWENVPGVLNTKDNAFGCFLAGLSGEDDPLIAPGGKWANAGCVFGPKRTVAWRTLDAQYFGLAQRRRRVFVVASAREGFDPTAVLFEFEGVRRDTAPRRRAGQRVAACLGSCPAASSQPNVGNGQGNVVEVYGLDAFNQESTGDVSKTIASRNDQDTASVITVGTLCAADGRGKNGQDCDTNVSDALTCSQPAVAGAICRDSFTGGMGGRPDGAAAGHVLPVAFHPMQDPINSADVCHSIGANSNATAAVALAMQVRRLTPTECERLQGFPDGYTSIPWRGKPADQCPDGPRYKALGNSWAVPVVAWIGQRINEVLNENP